MPGGWRGAGPQTEAPDMASEGGEDVSAGPHTDSAPGTPAASTDRDAGKKASRQQTMNEMFAGKANPPKRPREASESPGDGGRGLWA